MQRGVVSHKQASLAIDDAVTGRDSRKLAALVNTHNSIVNLHNGIFKTAEGEEAVAPPVPPMEGQGAAPAQGAAPGAPSGAEDPAAAIDQLLGALEQLVSMGLVP